MICCLNIEIYLDDIASQFSYVCKSSLLLEIYIHVIQSPFMSRLLTILHTILFLGQIMVLLSDIIGHLDALIITTNMRLLKMRGIIRGVARGALPPAAAWDLNQAAEWLSKVGILIVFIIQFLMETFVL